MKKSGWVTVVVAIAGIGMVGCAKKPAAGAPAGHSAMPPPAVRVMETKLEPASPVKDYIAQVEPIQQVHIMAQAGGIIKEVHFDEGTRVKQGDLLFTIEPAPYQALVEQRDAELAQAQAALERNVKYLAMLKAADNRSVSKSDLDATEANVAESRAAVKKSEAALHQAQIDLGYTKITSPIDGRIGRALITRGNLVSPSSGALATVIQIDPIRIRISMPDAEYMTAFAKYASESGYNPIIKIRLANGTVLPDEGVIDFDDNQMNSATGTMAIRVRFPNPGRMLVPNAYVNALVQDRDAPQRILLPAEAVVHAADHAYVWVLKDGNQADQAAVTVGAQLGEKQIIESGLEPGQRVVYAGMQKIRPGMVVAPIEAAQSK